MVEILQPSKTEIRGRIKRATVAIYGVGGEGTGSSGTLVSSAVSGAVYNICHIRGVNYATSGYPAVVELKEVDASGEVIIIDNITLPAANVTSPASEIGSENIEDIWYQIDSNSRIDVGSPHDISGRIITKYWES